MPFQFPDNLNPFNNWAFDDVPKANKIVIRTGGTDVMEKYKVEGKASPTLMLEGEISINIASEYAPLIPANQNTFLNLISGSFAVGVGERRIGSGQFVQQGIQVWKTTQPISFSLNAILMAQGSGRNEVMAPVKRLIALTLPDQRETKNGTGWGLVPPGPNISTIIGGELTDQLNELTGDYLHLTNAKGVLQVSIGDYLHFKSVVMTKCVPTFANGMVLEDSGDLYPVQCNLNMDFVTTEIATSNMINGIDNNFE